MRIWRLLLLSFLLWSCSKNSVEQIEVVVPKNVTVPPDMAYIPAGEFIMGHPDEAGSAGGRRVALNAYLIDRYEVTAGQFDGLRPRLPAVDDRVSSVPGGSGATARLPVTHVNFAEAEQYCRQVNKRLPTEAEWEKAARGTDGRKWAWGTYLVHPNNGFSGFLPEDVDKRSEWISPYGVYGMGYNVWEWVDDWYSGLPAVEGKKFKVIRGGLTQTHLTVQFTPTYARNWMDPGAAYNFIGFRCAVSVG